MELNFREYCETTDLVDDIASIIVESIGSRLKGLLPGGKEPLNDRILGGVGEIGKGALKGTLGAVTSPLAGIAKAAHRMWGGSDGVEKSQARSMLNSSKEELVRALLYMEPSARQQEIDKIKNFLNSIKDRQQDSWSMMSGIQKRMGGLSGGDDYKKLSQGG